MTEYQFARAFALAWLKMHHIPCKEAATANRIARLLKCWDHKGGNAGAKRSIIAWHEKALTTNRDPSTIKAENFYQSQSWRIARYEALKRSRGCCELCGCTPENAPLQVDHIKPRSKFPHLALELTNLQVLCRDCNLGKSNRDSIDWRIARRVPGIQRIPETEN